MSKSNFLDKVFEKRKVDGFQFKAFVTACGLVQRSGNIFTVTGLKIIPNTTVVKALQSRVETSHHNEALSKQMALYQHTSNTTFVQNKCRL
ncbi:CLUMA_CG003508, isoform A [Clunio marinus]|uniref:CLUMA_CG003508, isoform A n=1 Tax=Clunio marinus TaxID=568069 RepID=A0A1J1HP08_9DIPT|nr:CLUMA_CG003508, isoform A [Clunio marinus]